MKPQNLVDRLLEDANDGANLTKQEIVAIFHKDYTDDMGLVDLAYLGPSESGDTTEKGAGPPTSARPKSHKYLGLFDNLDFSEDGKWCVTHIFVDHGPNGLRVEFSGAPDFDSDDEQAARNFFNKEAHVKGGGKVQPKPRELTSNSQGEHEIWRQQHAERVHSGAYRGGRSRPGRSIDPNNPHWDGQRYAL
jgi:hypothetical protein